MPTEVLTKSPQSHLPPAGTLPARLTRHRESGLHWLRQESAGLSEVQVTLTPRPGETPGSLARRLADVLNAHRVIPAQLLVFGPVLRHAAMVSALKQALNDPSPPLTWVEGGVCDGSFIAGLQAHGVPGVVVRSITDGRGVVGRTWEDDRASHCVLSGLSPHHTTELPAAQTRETFERLQVNLARAGMGLKNVARTWFFLDHILGWYGEFNQVRNGLFDQCELRPGHLPASTGVGGRNAACAALTAAAWAVRPHVPGDEVVRFVASPCQGPATSYGSAFSRAVEITSAGCRRLLISGTASIEPGGRTMHAGSARAQIELAMHVVEAILESRAMTFADVARATAYYRGAADAVEFRDWLVRNELSALPVVHTSSDICRADLLFEIELDAFRPADTPRLTAAR